MYCLCLLLLYPSFKILMRKSANLMQQSNLRSLNLSITMDKRKLPQYFATMHLWQATLASEHNQ